MIERYAEKLMEDLMEQKEAIIFDQLKNLIRDGVLIIKQTEPVLIQDFYTQEIKLSQAVKLTFNAEEALESYRKQVSELRSKIEQIQAIIGKEK
jgi:uncharacterized protein with von Willebrand factor type A (vWA) domain